MRIFLLIASLFGVALATGAACVTFQSDDGPIDAGVSEARDDVVRPDVEDPDPEPPPGLPEGWELDRKYDKNCRFYVPKSEAYLPPPLQWAPCPSSFLPTGASCKTMVMQGGEPAYPQDYPAGFVGAGSVSPTGVVHLAIHWARKPGLVFHIITEADGPVRSAVIIGPKGCAIGSPSIVEGRYSLGVLDRGTSLGGGVLAGEISSPRPRLGIHLSPNAAHDVYAAPFALLDLSQQAMHQYSWENGSALGILWSGAQDNNLQHGVPAFANGAMFWPMSTSLYHKVKVYTASGGVKDFLTLGLVTDRGFADLGTDGKDLAWIYAKNRKTQTGAFDDLEIVTAPFTTDGGTVSQRRLRSESGPTFGTANFIVGCGFAARPTGPYIRLVRLADGQSWLLPGFVVGSSAPWVWSEPIALTCTEIYARVFNGSVNQFVRVRLDSLGPGIAPD